MTIHGDVQWAYGGKYVVIDDRGILPSGDEVAKWLKKQTEKVFITELNNMINSGEMSKERADKTLEAYIKETN